ncbi:hypothetical protein BX600DRAFT_22537 [Xylariales sp. PMI_506]|nr:hypothetical protein BX600DRAFT_22537 [Xylariales sp. PMI_506]
MLTLWRWHVLPSCNLVTDQIEIFWCFEHESQPLREERGVSSACTVEALVEFNVVVGRNNFSWASARAREEKEKGLAQVAPVPIGRQTAEISLEAAAAKVPMYIHRTCQTFNLGRDCLVLPKLNEHSYEVLTCRIISTKLIFSLFLCMPG